MRFLLALLLLIPGALRAAEAQPPRSLETPFLSLEHGLASSSRWLRPGKIDLLYRHRNADDSYNAFAWTPAFKGGGGFIEPERGHSTTYGGGFLRPLAGLPEKGDLILAAQGLEANNRRDYEGQAEYRFPFGLGFGGGFLEAEKIGQDVVFGKLTFRRKWQRWNYILEAQVQDVENALSPGGYFALFDEQWMAVAGYDGEQWRVTGGYVAPTNSTLARPAVEAIYIDNSIGDFDGPKSLFVNATLRLQGGFLAHPARLGRAMGPQGLEFGNPLGFIFPTWNRRLETWEMGGLIDLRYERLWFPNRTTFDRVDGAIFPAQFFSGRSWLDSFFAGASYTKSPVLDTAGVLGGWIGKIAFFHLNVGVEHRLKPSESIVTVGLIDWF